MSDHALHASPLPHAGFADRLRARLHRGWTRFVLQREIQGIHEAARYIEDHTVLKARLAVLRRELAEL